MSPADVLDKAADLIEQRGLNTDGSWFAGRSLEVTTDPADCPLCTIAALSVASGRHLYNQRYSREPLLDALISEIKRTDVATWSDTTPQPEVVATLRKVAADLRAAP